MSIFETYFLSYWFFISKNFFNEFSWNLWVFSKDFTFIVILTFHFKKYFFMNFHEVYEYFRKIFLFLSYWFIISTIFFNEFSWILWVFSKDFSFFGLYINFSFPKIFLMNFHEVYEYFPTFFLFLSYWFFIVKNFFSWIFMKLMSIIERFFCHINFSLQKFFFILLFLYRWKVQAD